MKKFLSIAILCALIIYPLQKLYFLYTDGFSLHQISSDLSYDNRWVIPYTAEEEEEAARILRQPFYYYGKGTQSYVFVSSDQQFILKFFKQKHLHIPWYLQYPLFPDALEQYRLRKIQSRTAKKNKLFQGYTIAASSLQEMTETVYAHLNKSANSNMTLLLYDKMGSQHSIHPDQYEFVLQTKMVPLSKYIQKKNNTNDMPALRNLFQDLIRYMRQRSLMGFADHDNNLAHNLGIHLGQVKIIDPGNIIPFPPLQLPAVYLVDITYRLSHMRDWLSRHYPHLLPLFDEVEIVDLKSGVDYSIPS